MHPPSAASPTEAKSEVRARRLAVGGAIVGPILVPVGAGIGVLLGRESGFVTGVVVGLVGAIALPSAGHWYAGNVFTIGLALRTAGAASLAIGTAVSYGCLINESEGGACGTSTPALLMFAGGVGYLAGLVWDVATADDAVRDWNRRYGLQVAPTAVVGAHGVAPGLAIGGRF